MILGKKNGKKFKIKHFVVLYAKHVIESMCAYMYVQGIAIPNSRSFISCKTRVWEPKMYLFWKKLSILLNSMPKWLLNLCAHVSRAFLYQISGHSVVKPGYRGQKCTFWAENAKKSHQIQHFVLLHGKPVINPCVYLSRTFLYQISGHLVAIPGCLGQNIHFLV